MNGVADEAPKMVFVQTIENGYMVENPMNKKVWMYGHLTLAMAKANELMVGVDTAAKEAKEGKEDQQELKLADKPAE